MAQARASSAKLSDKSHRSRFEMIQLIPEPVRAVKVVHGCPAIIGDGGAEPLRCARAQSKDGSQFKAIDLFCSFALASPRVPSRSVMREGLSQSSTMNIVFLDRPSDH